MPKFKISKINCNFLKVKFQTKALSNRGPNQALIMIENLGDKVGPNFSLDCRPKTSCDLDHFHFKNRLFLRVGPWYKNLAVVSRSLVIMIVTMVGGKTEEFGPAARKTHFLTDRPLSKIVVILNNF